MNEYHHCKFTENGMCIVRKRLMNDCHKSDLNKCIQTYDHSEKFSSLRKQKYKAGYNKLTETVSTTFSVCVYSSIKVVV